MTNTIKLSINIILFDEAFKAEFNERSFVYSIHDFFSIEDFLT